MQTAKRVAVNTGILYARMGITVFISLYSTRLVLDALGVSDFGIFNLVAGSISMLGFLNASMAGSTQRFMSHAQGAGNVTRLKKIFKASVLLHVFISLLLLILLEAAGYFFFNGVLEISIDRVETAKFLYQFMVVSTIFTVISVPFDAVINAHENMLLFALLGIIEACLKLAISFYITISNGDKLIIYGILITILPVLLLLFRWLYCIKNYTECQSSNAKYDRKLIYEMGTFAGWSLLGSSTSFVANYGQALIINVFFGTIANAAQGVANQISGQLGAFATTMQKALAPVVDKSEGAGERNLMIKATTFGSKTSFYLLMLFYVPIMVEMTFLFDIWLKELPPFVVIFCRLLLIKNLIEQLFHSLNGGIAAVGRIRKFQIVSSVLNILPLATSFLFFKLSFPVYTMYIIYIFFAIISAMKVLYFSNKSFGLKVLNYFDEVVLRCTVCFVITIVCAAIPTYIITSGYLRLIVVVLVSFIAFLVSVWNIGLTKSDRASISKIFVSRLTTKVVRLKFTL